MSWMLNEEQLEDVVLGSTILGGGGGGDPYVGELLSRAAIREHGPATIVDLADVPDDARVVFLAAVGAPGVLVEKLPRSDEVVRALELLERYLGHEITHVAPIEAGGLNAVTPIPGAVRRGLPIIDADGMGRAFPGIDMVTPVLHGGSTTPAVLADEHGNTVLITSVDNHWAERIGRVVTVESGCITMFAMYPMTGAQAREWLIPATLTRAAELGRLVRESRAAHRPVVDALVSEAGARHVLDGKVVEVARRTEGGFTMGVVTIEGIEVDRGRTLELRFQNEYLSIVQDGHPLVTVPDVIMTLDLEHGLPVPAEEVRYGFRVSVIALACADPWRTDAGLEVVGPRVFGIDHDFVPVETIDA